MGRGLVGTAIVATGLVSLGVAVGSAAQGGCPGDEYCTGPTVKITKGPEAKTTKKRATFKFTATGPGASFRCAVDNRTFKRCESPKKVRRLKPGEHLFRVQAVANTIGGPVARYRWKVIDVPIACRRAAGNGGCPPPPQRR